MWRLKTNSSTGKELGPREMAALVEASQITEQEIRQWHADFIDRNPTGLLTKTQFIEQYQKLFADKISQMPLENIFHMIDRNHDNMVDFNELLIMIVLMSRCTSFKSRMSFAFDTWNESGEGIINSSELTEIISAIYDHMGINDRKGERDPKRRAQQIINKFDRSGDKKLNKDEFVQGCENDSVLRELFYPISQMFINSSTM